MWTTAQASPAAERKGRYTPASTAHPAKMLPAVAAHVIAHYTRPGDLVLDPMCGIGTTLVEAVHAGRRAIGIEYEPHWVGVARANLALAHDQGVSHDGQVVHGDARQLPALLPARYRGQVALVVTSPPYGPSTHGQVTVARDVGITTATATPQEVLAVASSLPALRLGASGTTQPSTTCAAGPEATADASRSRRMALW